MHKTVFKHNLQLQRSQILPKLKTCLFCIAYFELSVDLDIIVHFFIVIIILCF